MSGFGLTDARRSLDSQARMGLQQAAQREQQIDLANDQLAQQDKAGRISSVATGAGIGTAIMPGVGTAIGAGIGLLTYKLF